MNTAKATHIRAGEITVTRLSPATLSFKIRLTVYTDSISPINDIDNQLFFGDGTSQIRPQAFPRTPILGKATWVNVYEYEHTYPAIGSYLIYYIGENRNVGVLNMSNSSNTKFYIETRITIDPFLGVNNSPVLTNPAVDLAGIGQLFSHNPAAYDPDGDSLSFENVASMQGYDAANQQGVVVNDYSNPAVRAGGFNEAQTGNATLIVQPVEGKLIWNAPQLVGFFNTAIRITEWRRGRAIGYVVRDIQIIVRDTRNRRPLLIIPRDTCVLAGTSLTKNIQAYDLDGNDKVTLSSYSGLYQLTAPLERAVLSNVGAVGNPSFGTFTWKTNCDHVRRQPYDVIFKAEDIPVFKPVLATTETWRITVVAPAPVLQTAVPLESAITLNWQNYTCPKADKIAIYRKVNPSNFVPENCNIGLPASSGFVKIGEVSATTNTFTDNNTGSGLKRGVTYCYRLVATFPNPSGGESYASNELCASLRLDVPIITKVSVLNTDADGQMRVEWTQPLELDKVQYPGPYRYKLFRADGLSGTNFTLRYETNTLTDTTFTDTNLDTRSREYTYRLAFYFGNNEILRDSSDAAASIQLNGDAGIGNVQLNWRTNVPWTNEVHYIYRKINNDFVLIDSILSIQTSVNYADNGTFQGIPLEAAKPYTYKIQTKGSYLNPKIKQQLRNDSYEITVIPRDSVAPCPPVLALEQTTCPEGCPSEFTFPTYNFLSWKPNRTLPCDTAIRKYNLYYAEYEGDTLKLLTTVTDTFFTHSNLVSLAGCYEVTALDAFGNESERSNRECKDNCVFLEFPNVFTPNGDNKNQVFKPLCITPAYIQTIKIKVYNRWGVKLYEGNGLENIIWDGNIGKENKQAVSSTYFFSAEAQFKRLRRKDEKRLYRGWVDLLK